MHIHQGLLPDLLPQVQTVIMIGHRASDHLLELARMAECRGRAVYRIESAAELQPRWFCGVDNVGLVVGAADLEPVAREVRARLDRFTASDAQGMLDGVAQ